MTSSERALWPRSFRFCLTDTGSSVLKSVVSGPVDADKQDYLLRDAYFCGVKYGIFDLQQLHRELQDVDDPSQGKQLMISSDGVHALEQFVLAKYT